MSETCIDDFRYVEVPPWGDIPRFLSTPRIALQPLCSPLTRVLGCHGSTGGWDVVQIIVTYDINNLSM